MLPQLILLLHLSPLPQLLSSPPAQPGHRPDEAHRRAWFSHGSRSGCDRKIPAVTGPLRPQPPAPAAGLQPRRPQLPTPRALDPRPSRPCPPILRRPRQHQLDPQPWHPHPPAPHPLCSQPPGCPPPGSQAPCSRHDGLRHDGLRPRVPARAPRPVHRRQPQQRRRMCCQQQPPTLPPPLSQRPTGSPAVRVPRR